MSSAEPRGEPSPYGQPGRSPHGQPGRRHGAARDLSRAVADRERGRRRLTAATATVSFASVVGAGVVAAVLPGSTHATVTTPGGGSASTGTGSSSSSGSQNSGSSTSSGSNSSPSSNPSNSSNSSNSQGNSSNLQAPAYTPSQSSGGGQATSGGSSSF